MVITVTNTTSEVVNDTVAVVCGTQSKSAAVRKIPANGVKEVTIEFTNAPEEPTVTVK